ncbi:MAG: O-succinylhomoserine sulfhydrylase [Sphingobacteriales bacterium SCN 48-20]|uniref:O-succinylhomoserine sulfhydrylase n=1 Tax=Terrimonas ferruginea TaxID=249 RepID=UPI00086AAA68|nr:O-succinylhomoserine sulfhydrylase [Terrimonas ferruginea]MBN8781509.1 O-succinylhomoserine sulfhydrylase [Terrimonas ferruginea]ODT94844.1 MAG: O-succinylhomoserine sulfhydrylase [Sphingobacteriales bacterium SCN 48-20]OJW44674.1 MAG: O-succinylhomoserine sulfhydrylase [Sphingobacteriales bacterium 48-107]
MSQHPETRAIRIQTPRTAQKEHATPLFLTSSFVYDKAEDMAAAFEDDNLDVNIYSRFSNPTVDEFIAKIASLEGAEDGVATGTGMAAVFSTFMTFLSAGDHILSASAVFGSTHSILTKYLPKWGITSDYFDMNKPESIEALIRPNTKMLYLETPSNPGLDIIDIAYVAGICKEKGILLVVDNCFATPAVQQPLALGADLVIHSATKFIDGQGRVLGGVVVGRKDLIYPLYLFIRNTGPSMSPFNAWVLTKSLETLHLRMEKHASNALALAQHFQNHPQLSWVKYPYLDTHPQHAVAVKQMSNGGGIVTFEIKGGVEKGRTFLNSLKMLSMTNNLGDSRSIASHPASTTHSKLSEAERAAVGITPGLIRISVGLEHVSDIIADIEQALEVCK